MMMKARPVDIDKLARQAKADKQNDDNDLLLNGVPFRPALWNILIEPSKPRTVSDGGIYTPEISQEAEEISTTIGRVLKCGPAAFEGRTQSGIELKNFLPGIDCPEKLIGKFVVYQLHTGQDMRLRVSGKRVKVLKLTDLLGDTEDPNAWKFYI